MLKKEIKYKNYEGTEVIAPFYFNYNKMDLIRLKARTGRDIQDQAVFLAESGDEQATIEFLEDLILTSYGVKTPDGKSFLKTKEIRHAFEYSEAYAELFVELLTEPGAMAKFASGLIDDSNKAPNSEKAELIAEHAQKSELNLVKDPEVVAKEAQDELDRLEFEAYKAQRKLEEEKV
ncbi:MAG: hypothetical protein [Caudoviricetes sp.]|nr:MAG: hypothetical protein [Caudoviricetes sp.]